MENLTVVLPRLIACRSIVARALVRDPSLTERLGKTALFDLDDAATATGDEEGSSGGDTQSLTHFHRIFRPRWHVTLPNSPTPTLRHLVHLLYALRGWLMLSPSHRVLLACSDGRTRCSIVAAAFLK